jgi:hypothetical protein
MVPFEMNVWMRYVKDTGKNLIKQGEIRYKSFSPGFSP